MGSSSHASSCQEWFEAQDEYPPTTEPAACITDEHVNSLLDHLNKERHTIKFTMEKESRNLPFLDTLLERREDRRLDISVYRKPTHTDRYLQYSSHHPTHVRRGVASCLFHRARMIAAGDNIRREQEHLWNVLERQRLPSPHNHSIGKMERKKAKN